MIPNIILVTRSLSDHPWSLHKGHERPKRLETNGHGLAIDKSQVELFFPVKINYIIHVLK
jgi:hypothetical protein